MQFCTEHWRGSIGAFLVLAIFFMGFSFSSAPPEAANDSGTDATAARATSGDDIAPSGMLAISFATPRFPHEIIVNDEC